MSCWNCGDDRPPFTSELTGTEYCPGCLCVRDAALALGMTLRMVIGI